MIKTLLNALTVLLITLYPLWVYLSLNNFDPRVVAVLILFVAATRWVTQSSAIGNASWLFSGAVIITLTTIISGSSLGLKLYPVIINLSMLIFFASSLRSGPSVIERLARLKEPNLPESGVVYTRKVTILWCVFFILNGAISLATSFASDEVWALYNGLISYILIGLLFCGEYAVRRYIYVNGTRNG